LLLGNYTLLILLATIDVWVLPMVKVADIPMSSPLLSVYRWAFYAI